MRRHAIGLAAAIVAAAWSLPASAGPDDVEVVTVKAAFASVKQDVSDAIVNRGYVIDHNARIGEMLDRTRSDVGSTTKIYSNAETVQFCSAVLSRKMMEADPANIAFCPYVIFYYEKADEPGMVHVGFRELDEDGSDASKTSIKAINVLLREILREVAGK